MERAQLAPLPPAVRLISNIELERLKGKNPGLWCTSAQPCLTCKGNKWFLGSLHGETVKFDCSCIDQMILHLWLLNAGVGWLYQRYEWSDADSVSQATLDSVLNYVDSLPGAISQGRGLVLHGSGGVGKTLLATLILKRVLSLGYTGQFFLFSAFLDAFAAGWKSEEEREWFMQRAMNTQILVLDDVGKESNHRNAVATDAMDLVMQARINSGLITIITTNLTPEQIESGYGGHILSRLAGNSEFIKLTGDNFRVDANPERLAREASLGLVRPVVLA